MCVCVGGGAERVGEWILHFQSKFMLHFISNRIKNETSSHYSFLPLGGWCLASGVAGIGMRAKTTLFQKMIMLHNKTNEPQWQKTLLLHHENTPILC